jgi:hypothetical protein
MNLIPTLTLNEHYNVVESVHFDLAYIKNLSAEQICGAYIANLLAALILVRGKDARVTRILKDATGSNLTSFKPNMNPVNIWGLALRKPESKAFKDYISPEVAKDLDRINGRILKGTFSEIHRPLSSHPHMIAWKDMVETVKLMLTRTNTKNYKTTIIANTIGEWDSLDNDDRGQAIAYTFHMLMQYDSNSPFIMRLHSVANANMLNSSDLIDKDGKVLEQPPQTPLKEDEGSAAPAAPAAPAAATGTTAGDIAPKVKKFHNGKIIHRVIRTFTPKTLRARTKKRKDDAAKTLA